MEIDGRYLHFRILKFPLMKCPDPKFVESTVLLLGGAITMLKNMISSMKDYPTIYLLYHENYGKIKVMFQTTNQIIFCT